MSYAYASNMRMKFVLSTSLIALLHMPCASALALTGRPCFIAPTTPLSLARAHLRAGNKNRAASFASNRLVCMKQQDPVDESDSAQGKSLYFNTEVSDSGNPLLVLRLVRNQAILGASALYTIASVQQDGSNISPSYTAGAFPLVLALLGALPLCFAGFQISRSPNPSFLDINAGTSLLALRLFGGRRNLPLAGAVSVALGLLTGVCEELSFRGLSLPILAQRLAGGDGAPPNVAAGLAASSVIFGLAHWSLGGRVADNLVTVGLQTCSGAWFGALQVAGGSNLLVPAVAHAAYDAFTLIEAHVTSTGQLDYARERADAAGAAPGGDAPRFRAAAAAAGVADTATFVDNALVIFFLADTSRDGRLDLPEVRAAVRQLDLMPSEDLLRDLFRRAAASPLGGAPGRGGGGGAPEAEWLDVGGWVQFVLLLRAQPASALTPAPEKKSFLGLR